MNIPSVLRLTCAALAFSAAAPASADEPADVVTPAFQKQIPNIPGKTLSAVIVDYPPGGASAAHEHAKSAFIFAYVISGKIESKVNDGPTQVFRAGESWYEPPASKHPVSRNASKTEPAKLLAVVIADTGETSLTTPVDQPTPKGHKQ
ncbi:cupin domain-containing protein [Phyllobacterium endophyticum]|uniref:cupin domain-containing protein n=1 Tax=Phyllobacterium endophyticum TaxID=1149773 RepID=UPI0011CBA59D|nr:cupin domain-containing protein [Phyllobacterium endophyticum]TXR46655.1 cupin domain-containing protein [Phyllobacterium endophyticum]